MKSALYSSVLIVLLFFTSILSAQQSITNDADVDRLIMQLSQGDSIGNDKPKDSQIANIQSDSQAENPLDKYKQYQRDKLKKDKNIADNFPETEKYQEPIVEEWRHPEDR